MPRCTSQIDLGITRCGVTKRNTRVRRAATASHHRSAIRLSPGSASSTCSLDYLSYSTGSIMDSRNHDVCEAGEIITIDNC